MTPRRLTTREIAVAVANRLFIDGIGRKAKRLVFEHQNEQLGGGWSFEPAVNYIQKVLDEMLEHKTQ